MNEWFLLVLLSLSSYRATRFVVQDDFPPMLWFRDKMVGEWRVATNAEASNVPDGWDVGWTEGTKLVRPTRTSWVPEWLSALLSCPWCASGWLSLGAVGLSEVFLSVPAPVLMWGATWALSSLLASQEWS